MRFCLLILLFISNHAIGQVIPAAPSPINKPQHEPPIVINAYSAVLSLDICKNEITVADPSFYFAGDTVLLIQMQGAVIDTSNTASFGTILDYRNAGNYEMNYISAIAGNKIIFLNKLTRQYDVPNGIVQLIRVPFIAVTNYIGQFTCQAWDGITGGILVLNAKTVNLLDDIDVSGRGFRSGEPQAGTVSCFENGYVYPASATGAGLKGESIALIPQNISKGKGSPAGGGGGGLANNSGGGGGGNGGSGGYGGYQTDSCGSPSFDNRGIGGKSLAYSSVANKVFMGGGGGAGHAENISAPAFGEGYGGGIVIIIAENFISNSFKIIANGHNARPCNIANCNDGMGGGGGGGTVLVYVNQVIDNVSVECDGGRGANVIGSIVPGGRAGPGGGGGGGVFFLNRSSLPGNFSYTVAAGSYGTIPADMGNPWGATAGSDGTTLFDLNNPLDSILFKPNIDSVRFAENLTNCNKFNFMGSGYTNTTAIGSWQWFFGDGGTAVTQNTSHTYNNSGTYTVKLIATDLNGCKDSTSKNVTATVVTADAGNSQSFCTNGSIKTTLNGSGSGNIYAWTPAVFLNDSTLQNPQATINTTTNFYLTVINNTGCSAIDSVKIIINPLPVINAARSNDINCTIDYARLQATGGLQYSWTPSATLSNANIADPVAMPKITTTYLVTGTDIGGCVNTDTVTVMVKLGEGVFDIPNTFSPNGDGINDCFGIKHWGNVSNLIFIIYNYLGEKVFTASNAAVCWDGNIKGQKAEPGNYVYYISGQTSCGAVNKKGNILLIR